MKQIKNTPSPSEINRSTKEFLDLLDRNPILLIVLDDLRKKSQRRGAINGVILVFLLGGLGVAVCLALGIAPFK